MGPSNHDDDGRKEEPTDLKAIIITIHVLLTVATVFGNSLVIRAFYKFSSLRSASNAILVSLSVADIFMTVSFILNIANTIVGKTPPPRVLCSFASTVSLTFNAIIILHLALISVERFIAIKFALRYQMIVTNRRATIASVVVWLWGIAVVLIFPQALKSEGLQVFKEFFTGVDSVLPSSSRALPFTVNIRQIIPCFLGGIITGHAHCDYYDIVQLYFQSCLESAETNSGRKQLARRTHREA